MKLLSFFKSLFIVLMLVLVMGGAIVHLRNCMTDEPSDDPVIEEPGEEVPVEDIILNETEIVF